MIPGERPAIEDVFCLVETRRCQRAATPFFFSVAPKRGTNGKGEWKHTAEEEVGW